MNVNLGLRATATSLSLSPFLHLHSLPDYNKCATLAPTTLAYCGEAAGGAAQLRSATNQRCPRPLVRKSVLARSGRECFRRLPTHLIDTARRLGRITVLMTISVGPPTDHRAGYGFRRFHIFPISTQFSRDFNFFCSRNAVCTRFRLGLVCCV